MPRRSAEFTTTTVNPVPWKSPTLGTKRIGGRVVPTSSPNAEMVTYQNALREEWLPYMGDEPPFDEPVHLLWEFHRKLNSYKGPSGRTVTKHACDLSNLVKASEDAIQPWLLTNDVLVRSYAVQPIQQGRDVDSFIRLVVTTLESS